MKREIKFRAWRENKMHFNITKAHYEHNAMSGSRGDLWDFAEWLKWSKVMQYTGLKDKNGVEIYEGDILERIGNGSFCKLLVYWDEPNCGFFTKRSFNLHGTGSPISDHNINISDWTYWVVVGNIFENPELIEA